MARVERAACALARSAVVCGAVAVFIWATYGAAPPTAVLVAGAVAAGGAALYAHEAWRERLAASRSRQFWQAVADKGVAGPPGPANAHILHPDGSRTQLVLVEDPYPCDAGHRCFLATMPDGSPAQPEAGDLLGFEQVADFHVTFMTHDGPRNA